LEGWKTVGGCCGFIAMKARAFFNVTSNGADGDYQNQAVGEEERPWFNAQFQPASTN